MLLEPFTTYADPESNADAGNARNPEAVAEVLAHKRAVANAAWWGFDAEDATAALQAAIRSGAKRVVVPNLGRDWIVRPLSLASDQELVLEPGAILLTAKRGAYRESGDGGRTWEREIVLRDDGGGRDIGYPRTVQRPDGKIVTIYYFHDQPKGDRYIAATI
jgi:hypothetical protein